MAVEGNGFNTPRIAELWNRHITQAKDPFREGPSGTYDQIKDWLKRNNIGQSHRIVDIGCGQGITSEIAAGSSAQVVGVDISQPLIQIAKANYRGRQELVFFTGDASNLQFNQDEFDAAMFINCLFHLDPHDMVLAIKELSRVTKQNGPILITTVNPAAYDAFAAAFKNQRSSIIEDESLPFSTKKIVGDPEVAGPDGTRIVLADTPFVMHPWDNITKAITLTSLAFTNEPYTFASLASIGGPNIDLFMALELYPTTS